MTIEEDIDCVLSKDYMENIYFIRLLELLADLYTKCECFAVALKILISLVYSYE